MAGYPSQELLFLSVLIELMMARTVTPTSAKTASQILAAPIAPRMRTAALTDRAKTIFWRTMRTVLLERRMALAILEGLSSVRTMSAASIAASLPSAPMAMPTSALARTGASLTPSPFAFFI